MREINDHIDDFAKKEMENMTFEYKESYWKEMEQAINKRVLANLYKKILVGFFGVLAVSAVVIGVYSVDSFVQPFDFLISNIQSEKQDTIKESIVTPVSVNLSTKDSDSDPVKLNYSAEDSYLIFQVNLIAKNESNNNSSSNTNSSTSLSLVTHSNTNSFSTPKPIYTNVVNNDTPILANANDHTSIAIHPTQVDKYNSEEFFQIDLLEPLASRQIEMDVLNQSPLVSIYSKRKGRLLSFVDLVGGIGYGENYVASSRINGVSGILGVNYNMEFNRLLLKTGLHVGLSGINGLHNTETKRVYGLSSTDLTNEINYNSMLAASVPLYIGYSGQNHSVSVGVKFNFLLNANGRVQVWDNPTNAQNVWGYTNGLQKNWVSIGADYYYNLNRRLSIGGLVDFDLNQRAQSINTSEMVDVKMWSAYIGLKYRLY